MATTTKINQKVTQSVTRSRPIVPAIQRHGRTWMSLVLVLSDVSSILLAGAIAVLIRDLMGDKLDPKLYLELVPVVIIFPLIYSIRSLYPAHGLGPVEELRRLTINTTLVFVIMTTFSFLTRTPPVYSRFTIGIAWLFALLFVPLARKVARIVCVRLHLWGEPVVILGSKDDIYNLSALLARSPNAGFLPIARCQLETCPLNGDDQNSTGCPSCHNQHVRIAFVTHTDLDHLEAIREKFRSSFEQVVLVTSRDKGLMLSRVEVRDFMYFKGLEVHQSLLDRSAQLQKRVLDILLSGAALLVLAPFLLVMAALVVLDSPGRVFYRQPRLGKNGRVFTLLKFRTMHANADQVLKSVLAGDPALKQEWDQFQKLKRDPRITRVGALLRRFSLDELPQLWNILTGEMSLVGPRPILLNQQALYGELLKYYNRVTPGLTGLWQISGRNNTTFIQRSELDVQYVNDWSLWLDAYILIRTVWVVLSREGAS